VDPDPASRFRSAAEVAAALAPRSRRWLLAAAAAALLALVSAVAAYRTASAPQQDVRLAVFPFEWEQENAGLAATLAHDVATHLGRTAGSRRTRFSVVAREHATHGLFARLRPQNGNVQVHATVFDVGSRGSIREWRGEYSPAEIRFIPQALAGTVTAAFHLPVPTAPVNNAALKEYVAGLAALRRNSTIDAALSHLERAVLADQDSALTHAALAEGLWLKYRLTNDTVLQRRAADSLSQAERRNPDLAEVHRLAGFLKAEGGWYEQALSEYGRAVELDPSNGDVYRRLGMVYDATNQPEKALAAYRRAVELDPGYYRNRQGLANFYRERGDYAEAAIHFRKTVELVPDEPNAHFLLGKVLQDMGSFAEAEKELRTAIALGETPTALNTLGAVLMYMERDAEAVPYIERALDRFPERYLWWMNLGTAYRRLNRKADAERANRRGLDLVEAEMRKNPRGGYARACLAYLCAWLGDRRRAESEIAQALQLSPHDGDTRRVAVKTYEALGRRDDALFVLGSSPASVLADVSRYPDLLDLRNDTRFQKLLATSQGK
jgi:tetratricopeptide (TPR) repeat protein